MSRTIHGQIISTGERIHQGHDTRPWTALTPTGEQVPTECCGSFKWLEPLLTTALCGKCYQPTTPPPGVVLYR